MYVIDQKNDKLYEFNVSTGSFTLCDTFTAQPWYVTVKDSPTDLATVTFNLNGYVSVIGTLTCKVIENSPAAPNNGHPFDLTMNSNGEPIATFNNLPQVDRYRYSYTTHNWVSAQDWGSSCGTGCVGQGIDVNPSTNEYYAAISGSSNKLVEGTI
jgi:hypothetical protein